MTPDETADNPFDLSARAEWHSGREVRCVRQMDDQHRFVQSFEMREVADGTGGTKLRFSGYASVVEHGYTLADAYGEFTETIARSAFNRTLSRGPDVAFLVNHDGVTMARTKPGTLKLAADGTGLFSEAELNPSRPDVQILRAAVEDGDLDEMSFAFRVVQDEWNEDFTERQIGEVNIHQGDVSVVNFGANPHTAGLVSMRHALEVAPRAALPIIVARIVRAAPTPADADVAGALAKVHQWATVAQAAQAQDPDNNTDPQDGKVWDHITTLLGAASDAMKAQAVDANPDAPEEGGEENQMEDGEPDPDVSTDPDDSARSAPPPPVTLPDHTSSARADLEALRRRNKKGGSR